MHILLIAILVLDPPSADWDLLNFLAHLCRHKYSVNARHCLCSSPNLDLGISECTLEDLFSHELK